MKMTLKKTLLVWMLILPSIFLLIQCQQPAADEQKNSEPTPEEMVARGAYLVLTGGCNDCHSPKVFTPMGPVFDTTRLLSGHPAGSPLPPIDTNALRPAYWYLAAPDLTGWVGPWGISYTANLTPDSATGLGAWTEENFIRAIQTGKHLGLEGGRPILPPMPWQELSKLKVDDLKAIFAYLKSLPAISNRVPAPVAPPDVPAMAMNK